MKIADNVFLINSWGSNCYVVLAKDPVLIDTGLRIRERVILSHLEALNTKIKHILLTHHDIDNIGNAAILEELTGTRVWASAEDIPYIQGDKERHGFKKYLNLFFRVPIPTKIKPLPDGISGIRVIPTPGHTPGHVCFLYNDILFVGDLLRNKRGFLRSYPRGWNWNNGAMMQSVRSIANYPFRWICPAHGRPIDFSPPRPEFNFTSFPLRNKRTNLQ